MAATSSMATSLESARLEGLLDEHAQAVAKASQSDDDFTEESHAALALVA